MNEQNAAEWQAPPPPEKIVDRSEPAQMSEAGTLASIFFEPGKTFEDLRRKPRFILAALISVVLITMFLGAFQSRIGYERIVREQIESSSWTANMPADEKQKMIAQQSSPITRYVTLVVTPLVLLISFFIGGLLYWGGVNAMGGSTTYLRAVAVWVYSGLPPIVFSMLANLLVLFLKSPDEIDAAASQQGLIQASPAFFIDTKAMPVLGALLGSFDLFLIWGWILAAIGLRVVGKISTGAAWAIVLIVALLNVASRVIGALFQG